jgi:uncharacterized protein (DUF433 family)
MNAAGNDRWKHLEHDPSSSYQQLSVKGRRIKARTIYGMLFGEGAMTPEEIAADRELPLEAVLETIAYCESNPPELAEDLRREEQTVHDNERANPAYYLKPTRRTPPRQEAV